MLWFLLNCVSITGLNEWQNVSLNAAYTLLTVCTYIYLHHTVSVCYERTRKVSTFQLHCLLVRSFVSSSHKTITKYDKFHARSVKAGTHFLPVRRRQNSINRKPVFRCACVCVCATVNNRAHR